MINEIKNIGKIIIEIKDKFGNIIYEAFKKLIASGIPPLTLNKCKGVDLLDYKIYGESVQAILPEEYQQVEYIESTGTQYLVIDYIASGITSTKGKFQITDITKAGFIFGSRGAAGINFYGLNWGGGLPYKYYNAYYGANLTSVEIDSNVHEFHKDKGTLYIDGNSIANTPKQTFTTPNNINVFGCDDNGRKGYLSPYAKIFYLQFYDEETLMVDLVPCYRKSDNEIGMYDLVNKKFYLNLGTGTFLKGSEEPTPEAPIEVESVGDKTTNLINYKKIINTTVFGITYINNNNGTITANGTLTGALASLDLTTTVDLSTFKAGETYYASCGNELNDGTRRYYLLFIIRNSETGTDRYFSSSNTNKTFTLAENEFVNSIETRIYSSNGELFSVDNVEFKPIICKASEFVEYEPYGYKIPVKVSNGKEEVITNIYLNEPLRKIGDYADYIDFENKKLIRNVHVDKISEISNVRYYEPLATYPYGFFTAYTQNTKRNGFEVLSNIYTNDRNGFKKDKNIMGNATGNNIYIIDKDYTDPVILINTLKDNEIHYVLATPAEEAIELPNIPTLKGTTVLSLDTNINASYMEVEYIGGGDNQLLDEENNLILNEIIATDTETELNITNTEINNILDEIIGG